ncbi:MAG: hypothetical protein H6619_05365 [Deltaproteobacteria bacterium]|nr:hypothetical protein [Deltaproteobacteria bacterium]
MNEEHKAVRMEVTKSLGILSKIEAKVEAALANPDLPETHVSEIKTELYQWLHLLENKPKELEVFLTGQNPRGKIFESQIIDSVVNTSRSIASRAAHYIDQLPTKEQEIEKAVRERKETFIGSVMHAPRDLLDLKAGDRLISVHTGTTSEVIGIQARADDDTKVEILFRHFDSDVPYVQKEVFPSATTDWIAHVERPSNAGEHFGKEIKQVETRAGALEPGVVFATKSGSRGVIIQKSSTALGDEVLKIIGRSPHGQIRRGKLLIQEFPFRELTALESGLHATLTPLSADLRTIPGSEITNLRNLQIGDVLVSNSGTTREVFEIELNPHKQIEYSFITRRPGHPGVEISILTLECINPSQINYVVRPDIKVKKEALRA